MSLTNEELAVGQYTEQDDYFNAMLDAQTKGIAANTLANALKSGKQVLTNHDIAKIMLTTLDRYEIEQIIGVLNLIEK